MIKVFSGQWRGIGENNGEQVYFAQLNFKFREVLHHFQGAKLAVFMAIALHANEDGLAWPPYDLLEKETGYRRDTIARALNDLCKTEIEGQRVLMRYRERDASGKYIGSNRYRIFPTASELTSEIVPESENLTVDASQSPKIPTLENTNSGKSDLKDNHQEKNNQPLSIKNTGASAGDSGQSGDLITGPNAERRKSIQAAMIRGAQRQAQKVEEGKPVLDLSGYPENVKAFFERFCDLSRIPLPSPKTNEGKDWVMSAEVIVNMPEFALDILDAIFEAKREGKLSYTIYRPGSIIKEVRRMIGERRSQDSQTPYTGGWTPETFAAMEKKIDEIMAQRAAQNLAAA